MQANNCAESGRKAIMAYAADFISRKHELSDIEDLKQLINGIERKITNAYVKEFYSKISAAYNRCDSRQRYILKNEIHKILDRLIELAKIKNNNEQTETITEETLDNKTDAPELLSETVEDLEE